jgi:hypothetical protein
VGNNGEEINLVSLSFGSDTEYLARMYVIVDSEVKRNGSLALGSLLRQGAIEMVMLVLEEQNVEREVVFPVFARYFLARGQSFEIMIEDLFKQKGSRDDKPPLVLSAEVPCLRHIAHKRMGYLRATYRLFKDTVSETEKDDRALVKAHMKMYVKHYHAIIPQLDIIESQGGVKIDHALSQDKLGLPRSKREKQKRQGNLEQLLRNQLKEPRKRMTPAPNYAETLEKFRARNSDGLWKGRETKGLLIKPKEDLQLLKKQIKSRPALQEEQLNHPSSTEPPSSSLSSSQGHKYKIQDRTPGRRLLRRRNRGRNRRPNSSSRHHPADG